jgi:hypothetical protein
VNITFSRPGGMDNMEMCSSPVCVGDQSSVILRGRGRQISAELFRMMSAGTELNGPTPASSELIVPVFPTTSMVAAGLPNTGKYDKNKRTVGDRRG